MTTDLEELRKLAEKATPGDGPVFAVGDGRPAFALADASRVSLLTIVSEGETDFAGFYEEADAAYFNAVRPATILALVSELEALREAVKPTLAGRMEAAFEHGITQQTQNYEFAQMPGGDWMFKCEGWFNLSIVLASLTKNGS